MLFADYQSPEYEVLELARRALADIRWIEGALLWAAIPLSLLPPIPTGGRWIVLRMLVVTAVIWISVLCFRIRFDIPWYQIVLDAERRNEMHDGVGGNAVWLMVGWIVPLAQSLFTLYTFQLVVRFVRWTRQGKTEPAGAAQPATRPESKAS